MTGTMTLNRLTLLLLTAAALLQTTPAPLRALDLEPAGLTQVAYPVGSIPVNPPTTADLNTDGTPESLALTGGQLAILSDGTTVWQSPAAWTVAQAAFTDLNRDGLPEATLLVWRPFGAWPVDEWLPHGGRISEFHDKDGNSCHLILIGWKGDHYGELWAGSALAAPVTDFAAADLNGDQVQELVTLEGAYAGNGSGPARMLKVWEWNGFGFTVVSEMEGMFSRLTLVQADDGRVLILVP